MNDSHLRREGSLSIRWENSDDPRSTPRYALTFAPYQGFRNGAQRPKHLVGDESLHSYLTRIEFTEKDAKQWVAEVTQRGSATVPNTMLRPQDSAEYDY
jgi:hypothetical protein